MHRFSFIHPSPLLLATAFLLVHHALVSAAGDVVAKSGDASIVHDVQAGTWAIAAGGTTLTLVIDPGADFKVQQLVTSANKAWIVGSGPDFALSIDGEMPPFGSRALGFEYSGVRVNATGSTLVLDATFDLPGHGLRLTRHYTVTSGSPAFETWTTYEPLDGPVTVANLDGFRLTVPSGAVHYVTGLQGDNADVEHDAAFTRRQKTLTSGEHFTLGAHGRSSEQTVPWISIDGVSDEFFAALMWSGSWNLTVDRSVDSLALVMGLPTMTTVVSRSVDGPHAVFGIVRGGVPRAFQSSNALANTTIKPFGLSAAGMYDVRSADRGLLGTSKGSDLMTNGIDVLASPNTASHVLIVTLKQ